MTEKPVIKIEHLNLGMLRGDSEKQILKDINLEIEMCIRDSFATNTMPFLFLMR